VYTQYGPKLFLVPLKFDLASSNIGLNLELLNIIDA